MSDDVVNAVSAQPTAPARPTESDANEANGIPAASPRVLDALGALQGWISTLYERSYARRDARGVVEVLPRIARRFCLGFSEYCVLLGVPEQEMRWVSALPWSHAALKRGRGRLYLIGRAIAHGDAVIAPVSISLQCDQHRPEAFQKFDCLQIKAIVASSGQTASLSRSHPVLAQAAALEMPLYVYEYDEDVRVPPVARSRALRAGGLRR